MKVLVVGAGAMGRWFAEHVDGTVSFADVDRGAADRAARAVGGRAVDLDATDGGDDAEHFDAICFAVPMGAIEGSIERHAGRTDRALLDVTGVMGRPLAAMESIAPECERTSLHPLFAPERAPGRVAVTTGRGGPVTETLLDSLAASGNVLVETTATEHDEAMETVQAATHAAVLSFAMAAEPVREDLATPNYVALRDLVGRVAGGHPRVYADVQAEFAGADAVAEAARRIARAGVDYPPPGGEDGYPDFERLHREAARGWIDDSEEASDQPDDALDEPGAALDDSDSEIDGGESP